MILGDPNRNEQSAGPRKPCGNCGGTEIYSKIVDARYGLIDLLPIGGVIKSHSFRIEVCGACGLTQWFVPRESLEDVKSRFNRE